MPDPPFPHTAKNRFPLPGVIKLDPLCPPPNAEPLDFMLAVMRGGNTAHVAENRGSKGSGSASPAYQDSMGSSFLWEPYAGTIAGRIGDARIAISDKRM